MPKEPVSTWFIPFARLVTISGIKRGALFNRAKKRGVLIDKEEGEKEYYVNMSDAPGLLNITKEQFEALLTAYQKSRETKKPMTPSDIMEIQDKTSDKKPKGKKNEKKSRRVSS